MTQAKGYAAYSAGEALRSFSFERREPGDHDIVIDIHYCGICHSDIHQATNGWGGSVFPMVPGHEIAGIVTHVGSKVTKFRTGDHAGVGCLVDSCRTCDPCHSGEEQYCLNGPSFTYNSTEQDHKTPTFGGYSDHIVISEDFAVLIPESLPLDAAAPLLCAGITLYSPLAHWHAGPGKKVAISGLGGLGHIGVKIARAMGAEVSILSRSRRKEQDGLKLGAHHFYAMEEEGVADKLRNSQDLIINTVSFHVDWNAYLNMLKVDGTLVEVGVPEQPVPVHPFAIIPGRKSLAGSMIGGIRETQEMLNFCAKHGLTCDIEKIPIQSVNEAYERVIAGDVRFRFVIDMESLKQE